MLERGRTLLARGRPTRRWRSSSGWPRSIPGLRLPCGVVSSRITRGSSARSRLPLSIGRIETKPGR